MEPSTNRLWAREAADCSAGGGSGRGNNEYDAMVADIQVML
jgi:hypothetical protein